MEGIGPSMDGRGGMQQLIHPQLIIFAQIRMQNIICYENFSQPIFPKYYILVLYSFVIIY